MYQLWLMVQIVIGWSMIIWIFDYMVERGLFTELANLIRDLRRRD